MDKPALLEQITADEREMLFQLREQARVASLGVTIAHRIDHLRSALERKRATIRRIENAADIVSRRTAGNRRQQQRED